jgi:hypothetical protein
VSSCHVWEKLGGAYGISRALTGDIRIRIRASGSGWMEQLRYCRRGEMQVEMQVPPYFCLSYPVTFLQQSFFTVMLVPHITSVPSPFAWCLIEVSRTNIPLLACPSVENSPKGFNQVTCNSPGDTTNLYAFQYRTHFRLVISEINNK